MKKMHQPLEELQTGISDSMEVTPKHPLWTVLKMVQKANIQCSQIV